MHSQVVSCSLGGSVGCCKGLRDSRPSVSGHEAISFTGAGCLSVVGFKIVEDLSRRRSKCAQQRLPLLKALRSYSLAQISSLIKPSDCETRPITVQEKILPAFQQVDLLQSVLDRWFPASFPCWTANFSSFPFPQWLIISILTSSLYLYSPSADALGFFGSNEAGNATTDSGRGALQKDTQDTEAYRARISLAIDLLDKGQNAQAQGDYRKALCFYEEVKQKAGDLALAEYARVGHAVTLYEIGDRSEAIIEMEDVSVALRGYPEIHAALAAALYVDKHAPMPAEKQFNIATLLDPRYTNVKWVEETKHWPPSLINSLKKFISLQ